MSSSFILNIDYALVPCSPATPAAISHTWMFWHPASQEDGANDSANDEDAASCGGGDGGKPESGANTDPPVLMFTTTTAGVVPELTTLTMILDPFADACVEMERTFDAWRHKNSRCQA